MVGTAAWFEPPTACLPRASWMSRPSVLSWMPVARCRTSDLPGCAGGVPGHRGRRRPALGAAVVAERVDTPRLLEEVRTRTGDRKPARGAEREARQQDRRSGVRAGSRGGRSVRGTRDAGTQSGRPVDGAVEGVTSTPLRGGGQWSPGDFLSHHSDRSHSWAANNIRNGANQDLQAYDFTFERGFQRARHRGVGAGTGTGDAIRCPRDRHPALVPGLWRLRQVRCARMSRRDVASRCTTSTPCGICRRARSSREGRSSVPRAGRATPGTSTHTTSTS